MSSSPQKEEKLDEWTESAIREVLNAGLKHGPKDVLRSPADCPLCSAPIAALRQRIRTLVEEARKEGADAMYLEVDTRGLPHD